MDDEQMQDLQNAALEAATAHIRGQRADIGRYRFRAICITMVACAALVCAAVVACVAIQSQQQTIIEQQQYALNMQYAQLANLLSGAEITETHEASADGDGSVAVAGSGNTTAGGDIVNGE